MSTRVLLVDDSEPIRSMMRMRLEEVGAVVVGEAENGRDAVTQAQDLQPDVVVMDLQMPVMDGIEATRAIRQASDSITVIGYTSSLPEAEEAMVAAGAAASFSKHDFKSLIGFIRSLG